MSTATPSGLGLCLDPSRTSKEPGWRDKRAGLGMESETSDKAGLDWTDLSVEVPTASGHME